MLHGHDSLSSSIEKHEERVAAVQRAAVFNQDWGAFKESDMLILKYDQDEKNAIIYSQLCVFNFIRYSSKKSGMTFFSETVYTDLHKADRRATQDKTPHFRELVAECSEVIEGYADETERECSEYFASEQRSKRDFNLVLANVPCRFSQLGDLFKHMLFTESGDRLAYMFGYTNELLSCTPRGKEDDFPHEEHDTLLKAAEGGSAAANAALIAFDDIHTFDERERKARDKVELVLEQKKTTAPEKCVTAVIFFGAAHSFSRLFQKYDFREVVLTADKGLSCIKIEALKAGVFRQAAAEEAARHSGASGRETGGVGQMARVFRNFAI